MLFVGKKNPEYLNRPYLCMNCGKTIDGSVRGLYERRFCSERCKDAYIQPKE